MGLPEHPPLLIRLYVTGEGTMLTVVREAGKRPSLWLVKIKLEEFLLTVLSMPK